MDSDDAQLPKKLSVKLDRTRYSALKQLGLRLDLPSQAILVQALDAYLCDAAVGGQGGRPEGALEVGSHVFVVSGRALGDDATEAEHSWLESVWRCEEHAAARVASLTAALRAAASVISAPEDLVGLSSLQRKALRDSVRSLDPQVQLGRHGAVWSWRPEPLRA